MGFWRRGGARFLEEEEEQTECWRGKKGAGEGAQKPPLAFLPSGRGKKDIAGQWHLARVTLKGTK